MELVGNFQGQSMATFNLNGQLDSDASNQQINSDTNSSFETELNKYNNASGEENVAKTNNAINIGTDANQISSQTNASQLSQTTSKPESQTLEKNADTASEASAESANNIDVQQNLDASNQTNGTTAQSENAIPILTETEGDNSDTELNQKPVSPEDGDNVPTPLTIAINYMQPQLQTIAAPEKNEEITDKAIVNNLGLDAAQNAATSDVLTSIADSEIAAKPSKATGAALPKSSNAQSSSATENLADDLENIDGDQNPNDVIAAPKSAQDAKSNNSNFDTLINAQLSAQHDHLKDTKDISLMLNDGKNLLGSDSSTKSDTTTTQSSQTQSSYHLSSNNIDAIAAIMVKKFNNGEQSFNVRLDPPELGEIEIELKFDKDKKVKASISASNQDTLGDLNKSVKELVQSLKDTGLDINEEDFEFTLNNGANDNAFSQQQGEKTKPEHDYNRKQANATDNRDLLETVTSEGLRPTWRNLRVSLIA